MRSQSCLWSPTVILSDLLAPFLSGTTSTLSTSPMAPRSNRSTQGDIANTKKLMCYSCKYSYNDETRHHPFRFPSANLFSSRSPAWDSSPNSILRYLPRKDPDMDPDYRNVVEYGVTPYSCTQGCGATAVGHATRYPLHPGPKRAKARCVHTTT